MTLDEFLVEVGKIGGWKLSLSGAIRRVEGDRRYCPLTAVAKSVANRRLQVSQTGEASKLLSLPEIFMVIVSADNRYSKRGRALRRRLLAACKLTEAA